MPHADHRHREERLAPSPSGAARASARAPTSDEARGRLMVRAEALPPYHDAGHSSGHARRAAEERCAHLPRGRGATARVVQLLEGARPPNAGARRSCRRASHRHRQARRYGGARVERDRQPLLHRAGTTIRNGACLAHTPGSSPPRSTVSAPDRRCRSAEVPIDTTASPAAEPAAIATATRRASRLRDAAEDDRRRSRLLDQMLGELRSVLIFVRTSCSEGGAPRSRRPPASAVRGSATTGQRSCVRVQQERADIVVSLYRGGRDSAARGHARRPWLRRPTTRAARRGASRRPRARRRGAPLGARARDARRPRPRRSRPDAAPARMTRLRAPRARARRVRVAARSTASTATSSTARLAAADARGRRAVGRRAARRRRRAGALPCGGVSEGARGTTGARRSGSRPASAASRAAAAPPRSRRRRRGRPRRAAPTGGQPPRMLAQAVGARRGRHAGEVVRARALGVFNLEESVRPRRKAEAIGQFARARLRLCTVADDKLRGRRRPSRRAAERGRGRARGCACAGRGRVSRELGASARWPTYVEACETISAPSSERAQRSAWFRRDGALRGLGASLRRVGGRAAQPLAGGRRARYLRRVRPGIRVLPSGSRSPRFCSSGLRRRARRAIV